MDTNAARLFVYSVAQAMDNATEHNTIQPPPGRVRARELPALGVADQVQRGQEHRPRRRQDAPRLRRHRLQARHGARALPPRRQGRLGDGPDQRGPAPVRRQGGAARVREPRLLEPALQPPRGRERAQEARRRRQARARRAAARRGREGLGARGLLERPSPMAVLVNGLRPTEPGRRVLPRRPGRRDRGQARRRRPGPADRPPRRPDRGAHRQRRRGPGRARARTPTTQSDALTALRPRLQARAASSRSPPRRPRRWSSPPREGGSSTATSRPPSC